MNLNRISIKEILIQNYKNIEYGLIDSFDKKKLMQDPLSKQNHMLGIYGQNGSGKTAVVEALAILKLVLSGKRLPTSVFDAISTDKINASFSFTFFIESKTTVCFVYYSFELQKDQKIINKEKIKIKQYSNQWGKLNNLIEVSDTDLFLPKKINLLIKRLSKETYFNMRLYKELANKKSCSYLFYQESFDELTLIYKDQLLADILKYLQYFGLHCIIVLQNLYEGVKHLSLDTSNSQYKQFDLLESNIVNQLEFDQINKSIEQLNKVIKTMIPSLYLVIKKKEQNSNIHFEIISNHQGHVVPLKNESSGIKKILSILHAIIMMFNNPLVTLAIDELDSGIFEYLLGELIQILEESNKGYLFFTSHNLRALERMNKESVIFTTVNPKQRFIRLHHKRSSSNLRELYFRNIMLNEQKEKLYLDGNAYQMKHYLRKAYFDG